LGIQEEKLKKQLKHMSINLIGINGYIGSGKDTVGNMIMNMTCKMSAREDMGSGYRITCSWEIKKFAEKLKQVASLLTGIPRHKFEDQEFKKTNLSQEWYREVIGELDIELSYWPMTVREFLQKLGTEAIRDGLHDNAWVNALFADYKAQYKTTSLLNRSDIWNEKSDREVEVEAIYPNWIITDTRFPNEAQAIRDRGGIVIRVNRDKWETYENERVKVVAQIHPIDRHPSETSLDNWSFNHIIDNNGTINDLEIKVKEFLDKFQIK
jgi:hypothetical protein